MLKRNLADYAEALYSANDLDAAFATLEKEVVGLGFDCVLYTYIPSTLVNSSLSAKPLIQVSTDYSPDYRAHYEDARFDRDDPLIKAVMDGVSKPIDWWGEVCGSYMQKDPKSYEVMTVSRDYGMNNGVTLPLLCEQQGIAGASFISEEKSCYEVLLRERLPQLQAITQMYHNLVLANSGYFGNFIRPVFASLNNMEVHYLAGLAAGKSQSELAAELHRSEKYLEQVMLKIRRKVSGVGPFDKPAMNRNQLLYYAGLVNIIGYAESLTK